MYELIEPLGAQCARDGWTRTVPWDVYEVSTGLCPKTSKSAWRRAVAELTSVYGVGVVDQDIEGFSLRLLSIPKTFEAPTP